MSNKQRPALERKVTRGSEKKRNAELDQGISVSVDGTTYTVRAGDLTSLDTMALRREVGYSFVGLMKAAATDADIDIIAALVWLSRRIDGERMLAYAEVAEAIGYDADIEYADADAGPEDDDHPEA